MERCSSGQGGDGRSGSKERRMVVGRDIGRAVGRIRGPDDAPGLRRPPPGGGARTVAGCAGRVPAGDPAPGGRPWYRPDGWRGPRSEAGAGGARPPEPDDRHRTRRPGLRRARPPHPRLLPGVLRGRHGSLAGPQRGGERVRPGVRPESGDPVRRRPGKRVPDCGGRSQIPARGRRSAEAITNTTIGPMEQCALDLGSGDFRSEYGRRRPTAFGVLATATGLVVSGSAVGRVGAPDANTGRVSSDGPPHRNERSRPRRKRAAAVRGGRGTVPHRRRGNGRS